MPECWHPRRRLQRSIPEYKAAILKARLERRRRANQWSMPLQSIRSNLELAFRSAMKQTVSRAYLEPNQTALRSAALLIQVELRKPATALKPFPAPPDNAAGRKHRSQQSCNPHHARRNQTQQLCFRPNPQREQTDHDHKEKERRQNIGAPPPRQRKIARDNPAKH